MRRTAVLAGAVLAAVVTGSLAAATVNVHVGSYYFEDASNGDGKVVAAVGDQLRFLVDDNGGTKPHSVVVTELGIDSGPLIAGSTYVTPVLDRPGTFTLFCRVHRVNFDHFTTLVITGEAATPKPTPPPTPRPSPTPAGSPPGATATTTAAPGETGAPASTPGSPAPGSTSAPGTTIGPIDSGMTPPASDGPPGQASHGSAPSPGATAEGPLAPGVTGPPTLRWLRSVLVGALALPGVVIVAAAAWLVAGRRGGARS